nr:immunoglobulin light chain junction region [Macaca mulatta]
CHQGNRIPPYNF